MIFLFRSRGQGSELGVVVRVIVMFTRSDVVRAAKLNEVLRLAVVALVMFTRLWRMENSGKLKQT